MESSFLLLWADVVQMWASITWSTATQAQHCQ